MSQAPHWAFCQHWNSGGRTLKPGLGHTSSAPLKAAIHAMPIDTIINSLSMHCLS